MRSLRTSALKALCISTAVLLACAPSARAGWPTDWPFTAPDEGWFFYHDPAPPSESAPEPSDTVPPATPFTPPGTPDRTEPPRLAPPPDSQDPDAAVRTPSTPPDGIDDDLRAAPVSGPALDDWLARIDDARLEALVTRAPASALRAWVPALLDQALTALTKSSVRKYLLVQQESLKRSDRFSKLWQEVVWTDPSFDRPGSMPLGTMAQTIYEEDRAQAERRRLASLGPQISLLVVVAPNCRPCEAQWRILQTLKDDYGFTVRPIAQELLTLSDSSLALPYPSIIRTLAPRELPSLYAVSIDTGEVVRVGSGLLAQDEIITRLLRLLTPSPQKGAPHYVSAPTTSPQTIPNQDHDS